MTKTTILTVVLFICLICYTTADTMFVGGKEYPLDPNIPPLYQYVKQPDPFFEWHDLGVPVINNTKKGFVQYEIEFTSQQWLTENDVDRSIWKHNLTIIVPYDIDIKGLGCIYITGCSQDAADCVKTQASTVEDVAIKAKTIVAVLTQIPNARIIFKQDPTQKSRSEDAIVAYTWRHVLDHPTRPDWVVYYPMVKASIAAMEALKQWSYKNPTITSPIEKFYPAGASKRGATTWFTAAYMGEYMSDNILGAAPIVFDTLNFTQTVPSMYEQLGGWTFAFVDYQNEGIVQALNNQTALIELSKHVDPMHQWYYNGLKKVPKLIVSAVGDEFFLIRNDQYYYDNLPNRMRLMIPDAEHSLITGVTYLHAGAAGHLRALAGKQQMPRWIHRVNYNTRTTTLFVSPKPTTVAVFKSQTLKTNPPRMDFRLVKANIEGGCLPPASVIDGDKCFAPVFWNATKIDESSYQPETGYHVFTYTAQDNEIPTDGTFFGFYLIASWENDHEVGNQVYSTQVMVLPEKFPFPPCQPNCPDNLV